jgi:flagellar protein FliO/FliZ
MTLHLVLPLLAAGLFASAAAAEPALAPPVSAPAPVSVPAASVQEAPEAPAPAAPLLAAPAAPAPSAPMPLASSSSAGSLLQTILALSFVLALLIGMAWFMKRYGPKTAGNGAALRVLGTLSLGGRERVMLIEAAGQWIVVGAAPGRVNLLCTLERQSGAELALPQNGLVSGTFAEWLRQTIEKRNGK